VKAAGIGLEEDFGSGYWIGKELILSLSFSRNEEQDQDEFSEILDLSLNHYQTKDLNSAIDRIMISDDRYSQIASLAKPLIGCANNDNQIALSIIQQSSQYAADYILTLADQISYTNNDLFIIANGGILNSSFYRQSLTDALSFDFDNINWLLPSISTAYYPGLLSCKILGLSTTVKDILKENPIA